MAKYVSNKFKDLQVGLSDYSESKTSLEVVGAAVIGGITTISPSGINITGVITATSFSGGDIDGEAVGIIGEDLITRNLKVSGISTFDGNIDIGANGSLDVDGHTELDDVNVTGVATFSNSEGISVNTKIVHTGDTGTNLVFNTGYVSLTADGSARLTAISSPGTHEGVIITGDLRVNNALGVSTFTGGIDVGGTSTIGHLEISDTGIVTAKAGAAITYYGDGSKLTGIDASTIGDLLKINVIGISTFTGETNLNGDVNVGIATTNKITVTGRFDSDLIPYDKDTRDLGNESNKWRNIYVNNINLPGGGTAGEDIVTRNLNISGVSTLSGYVGLGTDLTVAGFSTLSYGAKIGKLDVDNSGIVTAVSGIITYYGDGSYLTGIDATSIKDGDGTVRAQANTSGVVVTGILTATTFSGGGIDPSGTSSFTSLDLSDNLDVDGHTELDDLNVTGVSTFTNDIEVAKVSSSSSITALTFYGNGQYLSGVATAVNGNAVVTNLYVSGVSTVGNVYTSGIITASSFVGNLTGIASTAQGLTGSPDITVGNIVGSAATFNGNVSIGGTLTYEDVTNIDSVGIITAQKDVRVGRNFNVTGVSTFTDAVSFGSSALFDDNAKIILGAGGTEFQVYHDGSTSIIKSSEGNLNLQTVSGEVILGNSAGEVGVSYKHDDRVLLRYDNSDRFQTTGYGVTVYGTTQTQTLNVSGVSTFTDDIDANGNLFVGSGITMYQATGIVSATSFYGDGSHLSNIDADTIGDLTKLVVSGITTLGNVKFETAGIVTAVTGVVTFYGDGSNLTGVATALNGNAVASNLHVSGVSTFMGQINAGVISATSFIGDGSQLTNVLRIEDQGSSVGSSATTINFVGEGVSAIYSNGISTVTIETTAANSSKWITTAAGIHTLSNVGVGTTNPQTSLQVGDIYGVESGIGTWTAAAGIAHTINQYTIATNDFKTAEYTVHIGIGTKMQSQKVLVMQNGTTAYSQEYAVMYSNDLLVSIGSTIESGVMKLHVTPDTGISGLSTYRFSRQTML